MSRISGARGAVALVFATFGLFLGGGTVAQADSQISGVPAVTTAVNLGNLASGAHVTRITGNQAVPIGVPITRAGAGRPAPTTYYQPSYLPPPFDPSTPPTTPCVAQYYSPIKIVNNTASWESPLGIFPLWDQATTDRVTASPPVWNPPVTTFNGLGIGDRQGARVADYYTGNMTNATSFNVALLPPDLLNSSNPAGTGVANSMNDIALISTKANTWMGYQSNCVWVADTAQGRWVKGAWTWTTIMPRSDTCAGLFGVAPCAPMSTIIRPILSGCPGAGTCPRPPTATLPTGGPSLLDYLHNIVTPGGPTTGAAGYPVVGMEAVGIAAGYRLDPSIVSTQTLLVTSDWSPPYDPSTLLHVQEIYTLGLSSVDWRLTRDEEPGVVKDSRNVPVPADPTQAWYLPYGTGIVPLYGHYHVTGVENWTVTKETIVDYAYYSSGAGNWDSGPQPQDALRFQVCALPHQVGGDPQAVINLGCPDGIPTIFGQFEAVVVNPGPH